VTIDNIEYIYDGPRVIFYSGKIELAPRETNKKFVIFVKILTAGRLSISGVKFYIKNLEYEVSADETGISGIVKNDVSNIFNINKLKQNLCTKLRNIDVKPKFPQIEITRNDKNNFTYFSCEDICFEFTIKNILVEGFFIKRMVCKVQYENGAPMEYVVISEMTKPTGNNGLTLV
jgi:hypothetical protein